MPLRSFYKNDISASTNKSQENKQQPASQSPHVNSVTKGLNPLKPYLTQLPSTSTAVCYVYDKRMTWHVNATNK